EVIERLDADLARIVFAQELVAGELRHAVHHLAATPADGHAARPPKGEAAVEMVLDVLQALEHRRVVAERHLERLEMRLASFFRVVAQPLDLDRPRVGHAGSLRSIRLSCLRRRRRASWARTW